MKMGPWDEFAGGDGELLRWDGESGYQGRWIYTVFALPSAWQRTVTIQCESFSPFGAEQLQIHAPARLQQVTVLHMKSDPLLSSHPTPPRDRVLELSGGTGRCQCNPLQLPKTESSIRSQAPTSCPCSHQMASSKEANHGPKPHGPGILFPGGLENPG